MDYDGFSWRSDGAILRLQARFSPHLPTIYPRLSKLLTRITLNRLYLSMKGHDVTEDLNTPPEGTPIVNPPTPPPTPDKDGATAKPPEPQEEEKDTTPLLPLPDDPLVGNASSPLNEFGNFLKGMFTGFGASNARRASRPTLQAAPTNNTAPPIPVKERSAIEKMRDTVAEFDEDYKSIGERLLGFFMQLVGYLGPFALVAFVGSDLGKYYTPVMDTVPAYGLAFTIECIIGGSTIAMGRSFAEIANGKANWSKAVLVISIWLMLNCSSALGLYLVITRGGVVAPGITQISMLVRVIAIALGDLGCSSMLMFKGQSMQKHIDSIRKRATAIGELADAQRSIEEADKNAALREQMMQATLKIQEDLSAKIGDAVSMVMESILTKMEKALKDDGTKNERGYGKH